MFYYTSFLSTQRNCTSLEILCDTFDYKELVTSYKVSLVWYCNRIGKESPVRVVVKPKTVIPDLGKNITEGNELVPQFLCSFLKTKTNAIIFVHLCNISLKLIMT